MVFRSAFQSCFVITALASGLAVGPGAFADEFGHPGFDPHGSVYFLPGNLLVSRVVYDDNPNNVTVGEQLPPGCSGSNCAPAVANGAYPYVWNNDSADASFGITAKIFLDQLDQRGHFLNSLEVPSAPKGAAVSYGLIGSFSSKSEDALNLSIDGRYVTFMGYLAPNDTVDVSNSNTPGVIDPTNPVPSAYYRVVAKVDAFGKFDFTLTNAYSGNNGRAAILNNSGSADFFYTAGNAGNGSNPQPAGVVLGAGAQFITPSTQPESVQISGVGLPAPVGSFSVTELGDKADKLGKDTNFRGLTIFNNVIYTTKGSGSNGIDTVYFIDTSGQASNGNPKACPNGVGVPAAGVSLPTMPVATTVGSAGVTPLNMCVLSGFSTALAKNPTAFPFGLWFANATTLYVADEGNGTNTYDATQNLYTAATSASGNTGGLQKWVLTNGSWTLAYTLTQGLNLGAPYAIPFYPKGNNAATGLPWAPATDGLRNLTGRVNGDGTVTIWAITSTVSGNGDQGADPNRMVVITDKLAASTAPANEVFNIVRTAGYGEVLRGVSFTPESRQVSER